MPLLTWFNVTEKAQPVGFDGKPDPNREPYESTGSVTGRGYSKIKTSGKVEATRVGTWGERVNERARPEGLLMMIAALLFAVAAVAGAVLLHLFTTNPALATVTRFVLAGAMAGALVLLVWFLGWVIKIVLLSRKMSEEAGKVIEKEIESSGVPKSVDLTFSTMPGLGLFLALAAP